MWHISTDYITNSPLFRAKPWQDWVGLRETSHVKPTHPHPVCSKVRGESSEIFPLPLRLTVNPLARVSVLLVLFCVLVVSKCSYSRLYLEG